MNLLISHIADLDGVTPVILMNLIKKEFEYKLFEIEEVSDFIENNLSTNYFDKYDDIYIVDLGIKEACAKKIVNSKYKNKFRLFDHHESNYYLNDYDFAKVISEVNGFKECGTTIFFNYLANIYGKDILKPSIITFVELVRENDTWQFTDFKEDAMNLNALFSFYGIETYVEKYTKFLKENDEFYFNEVELTILKSLNNQKEAYIEMLRDKVIFKEFMGYKIGFVFAEQYRSYLGNYLANYYKDKIDFVCIIDLTRHVSLRGIKDDIPVNKFAEIYGGGGHKLTAALPFPSFLKETIIDYIFGGKNGN